MPRSAPLPCSWHSHLPDKHAPCTPRPHPLAVQLVILDREAAHAATADILTQHCIPHDRSEDLRAEAAAAAGGDAAAGAQEALAGADAAAPGKRQDGDEEEEPGAAGMDVDVGEEAKSGGHGKPGGGARPAR